MRIKHLRMGTPVADSADMGNPILGRALGIMAVASAVLCALLYALWGRCLFDPNAGDVMAGDLRVAPMPRGCDLGLGTEVTPLILAVTLVLVLGVSLARVLSNYRCLWAAIASGVSVAIGVAFTQWMLGAAMRARFEAQNQAIFATVDLGACILIVTVAALLGMTAAWLTILRAESAAQR